MRTLRQPARILGMSDDLDQGVGVPVFAAALVVIAAGLRQWLERTAERRSAQVIQPALEQQRAVFAGAELEAALLRRPVLLGRETFGVEGVPKVMAEMPEASHAELAGFLE